MKDDLEAFAKWLAKDYRPRTVQKTVTDLRSYISNPSIADSPPTLARAHDYQRAYARYVEFLGHKPRGVEPPPKPSVDTVARRKPRRPPKSGIDREAWERMWKVLDRDMTPAGYALAVMMATGLRAGDVLRVTPTALANAFRHPEGEIMLEVKGGKRVVSTVQGAPDEWQDLYTALETAGRPKNVAAFISPESENPETTGAAYMQLRQKLRQVAQAAQVDGAVHLHRLRYTVAGNMLDAGATREEVQQILGHESGRTTDIYLRGFHSRLAAKGLSRIRRKRET